MSMRMDLCDVSIQRGRKRRWFPLLYYYISISTLAYDTSCSLALSTAVSVLSPFPPSL